MLNDKCPWNNDQDKNDMFLFAAFFIVFIVLVALFGTCARKVCAADNTVVFTVNDFSKGMTPVIPPYANNPEAIVYSKNMYSLQPGGRQIRYGTVEIVKYDSTVASDPIDALAAFSPVSDSGAIIYAAGGHWYRSYTGTRWTCDKFYCWADTFFSAEISPYTDGDSVHVKGDSVVGVNTRFVRDLSPGDTITVSDSARVVSYIVSDEKLFVTNGWGVDVWATTYTCDRVYSSGGDDAPFLLASGDMMYTGNYVTDPQVIYNRDSGAYIRNLGIVDSFYIDSIYWLYPDSAKNWNSVSRRSWDTLKYSGSDSVIFVKEFQLVSRRKAWEHNQWFESVRKTPESYYIRVGYEDKTVFYQIAGNSDTAIYCMAWFVDAMPLDSASNANNWNDSLYGGHGTDTSDIPSAADVVGKWGYVMASAGVSDVTVPDDSTGDVFILGRGAMFYTVDASFPIDSTEAYTGMLFIHLTGNDVDWGEYSSTSSEMIKEFRIYRKAGDPAPTVRSEDSLIATNDGWYTCDDSRKKPSHGNFHLEPRQPIYYECPAVEYVYHTLRTNIKTKEAQAVGNSYFPLRHIVQAGDTLFFITGVSTGLESSDTAQTSKWEIVKVGMPRWSGMEEWNTPPQLVAWGDTAAPSVVSFSGVNDPWNWSATNDVLVGNDPSDPLIACVGYDDQLVLFKRHSILGYDGSRFTELSQTEGLVGRRAVVGLNKFLYWLDADGVYRMARRDFSGYSVEKVSTALEPAFNTWNASYYGSDVVPFAINPTYRYLSVMSYNKRDNKLYLFYPNSSDTSNSRCLTYDTRTGVWDGVHTLRASDAIWGTVRDTARIIMGNPDSALIFGLDYAWNDLPPDSGIDATLRSSRFYVSDAGGWPMESRLSRVRLLARTANSSFDTKIIKIIGDNSTDTLTLSSWGSFGDYEQVWRPSSDNISEFWQWEIYLEGAHSSGQIFTPYQLQIEVVPVNRKD